MIRTAALMGLSGIGTVSGYLIGQNLPISDQTPVTLAILVGGVVTAFGMGVGLTSLRRDIRELKGIIHQLPCIRGPACPQEDEKE